MPSDITFPALNKVVDISICTEPHPWTSYVKCGVLPFFQTVGGHIPHAKSRKVWRTACRPPSSTTLRWGSPRTKTRDLLLLFVSVTVCYCCCWMVGWTAPSSTLVLMSKAVVPRILGGIWFGHVPEGEQRGGVGIAPEWEHDLAVWDGRCVGWPGWSSVWVSKEQLIDCLEQWFSTKVTKKRYSLGRRRIWTRKYVF